MNYLQNDKLANIVSTNITTLISRKFQQGKRLLDIRSGGLNTATRCYYFIDQNQEHIVNTVNEIRDEINGYDVELLMTHWKFIDIEDHDNSMYVYNAKIFEISSLVTDSFTASTDFLDELWENKDTKILKRIYAYEDEIFDSERDLIEYLRSNREFE